MAALCISRDSSTYKYKCVAHPDVYSMYSTMATSNVHKYMFEETYLNHFACVPAKFSYSLRLCTIRGDMPACDIKLEAIRLLLQQVAHAQ